MSDPLYGLTASVGLHVLKDTWGQKAHLKAQCCELASNLREALANTVVPNRNLPYFEIRPDRNVQIIESVWEDALWRWSQQGKAELTNCWSHFVSYQVPLFAKQKKERWGYIDLLGIDTDGSLAVLELKKEPSRDLNGRTNASETPLRMILEAAAYAEALRRNWKVIRPQLLSHLQELKLDSAIIAKVPLQLSNVRLFGVAPADYWTDWLPLNEKGKTVSPAAWESFRLLLDALEKNGLPTSFVTLYGDPLRLSTLKARLLKGFPLG